MVPLTEPTNECRRDSELRRATEIYENFAKLEQKRQVNVPYEGERVRRVNQELK